MLQAGVNINLMVSQYIGGRAHLGEGEQVGRAHEEVAVEAGDADPPGDADAHDGLPPRVAREVAVDLCHLRCSELKHRPFLDADSKAGPKDVIGEWNVWGRCVQVITNLSSCQSW